MAAIPCFQKVERAHPLGGRIKIKDVESALKALSTLPAKTFHLLCSCARTTNIVYILGWVMFSSVREFSIDLCCGGHVYGNQSFFFLRTFTVASPSPQWIQGLPECGKEVEKQVIGSVVDHKQANHNQQGAAHRCHRPQCFKTYTSPTST